MFPTNQNFLSANAGLSNGNNVCFPMYLSSAPTAQTINAPYGVVKIGQIAVVPRVGSWICIALTASPTGMTATWDQIMLSTNTGTAGQFLVSNGVSADPTFQTATPQLTVTTVAGTTQAMLSNRLYIANNAAQTTFTLPATSSVGDVIRIVGSSLNAGGWIVTYSTGQIIWGPAGSSTATTGNADSANAAAQAVALVCTIANTTWCIMDNSGTITLT